MGKITLTGIGKIAIAIGFSIALCGAVTGSALAADHDNGGHQASAHGDRGNRGDRGDRGHDRDDYRGPGPAYYYAPAPNYYVAPEPDYYSYPDYAEPAPQPQGINLFFGL